MKDDLQAALDVLRGRMDRLFGGELRVFSAVVVPLVEADRLSVGIAAECWIEELTGSWQDDKLSLLFRSQREGPFTEEAAILLAYSDQANQRKLLRKLDSASRVWKRAVQRPLAAEANWSEVDRSFRMLMWMGILLMATYQHIPRPHRLEESFAKLMVDVSDVVQRRPSRDWDRSSSAELYEVYKALAANFSA